MATADRFGSGVDPHTANALNTVYMSSEYDDQTTVAMETALPFKFPDQYYDATGGRYPQIPWRHNELPKYDDVKLPVIKPDPEELAAYIREHSCETI